MSRIVEEKVVTRGAGKLRSGSAWTPKEVAERIAKYVPAEIIAGYVTATGVVENVKNGKLTLLIILFIVCVVCTPIYIVKLAKTRQEKLKNGVVATLAFLAWSYAYGGLFKELQWHDPAIGSFAMIIVTIISGATVPIKIEEAPQPELLDEAPETGR
jgi:hypothetical protein